MTIVTVIGTRPQYIKAAVVSRALQKAGIEERIVDTGQHYDQQMSAVFLRELGISNVVANLGVGSGTHTQQTARAMTRIEQCFSELRPDAVLVFGDTNATLAAALVASKNHIPLLHVEAGLRSQNRKMPEEINRIITDHISNVLFCSSETGVRNLSREGIVEGVVTTGDVMLDAFNHFRTDSELQIGDNSPHEDCRDFGLVTIHRPANTNNDARLLNIIEGIENIGVNCLWPAHPRVRQRLDHILIPKNIRVVEPVGYLQMIRLLDRCAFVFTDSGGLQKEAYWAKKKCVTIRAETEWTETLTGGWNTLVDPGDQDFVVKCKAQCQTSPTTSWVPLYGDGNACIRIVDAIKTNLQFCASESLGGS